MQTKEKKRKEKKYYLKNMNQTNTTKALKLIIFRVCLRFAYFAETENFLLEIL